MIGEKRLDMPETVGECYLVLECFGIGCIAPDCEYKATIIKDNARKLVEHNNEVYEKMQLLEQAAEEIENCYGRETELSKKIRGML